MRWRIGVALVGFVALTTSAVAAGETDEELWRRAALLDRAAAENALTRRGDWAAAIAALERVVARFPLSPRAGYALYRLAQIHATFIGRSRSGRDRQATVRRLKQILLRHAKSDYAAPARSLLAKVSPGDARAFARAEAARTPTRLVAVKVVPSAKSSRVSLALNRSSPFRRSAVPSDASSPARVFFDLPRAAALEGLAPVEVAVGPVARVRFGPENGVLRIALDLRVSGARVSVSHTEASIEVDVVEDAPAPHRSPGIVRRIVLDAGHGGEDPGASGTRLRTREKNVTLAIAKITAERLKARGYDVIMTRDGDYAVSLEERTAIANRERGDLFVSIHANWNRSRKLSGVETYILNISDDRYADRIARRENAAPFKGKKQKGMRKGRGNSAGAHLNFILADLATRANVAESLKLAKTMREEIVRGLAPRFGVVKFHPVRQALFYVLVGAKMPAVLLETSYLSNATDEARLRTVAYQTAIAESIVRAVSGYAEAARAKE